MNMHTIRIEDVKVTKGRIFNEKNVERLMKSIQEVGLMTPIFVSVDGVLVAGMHRLEAMRRLGFEEINAIVTEETDTAKLKIMEITENMARNEKFTPAEMCKMAWEARKSWIDQGLFNEGHKQKEGEQKLRNEDLANLTKVSKSTIKNYLRVWERLSEKMREYIMDNREAFSMGDLMELTKEGTPVDETEAEQADYDMYQKAEQHVENKKAGVKKEKVEKEEADNKKQAEEIEKLKAELKAMTQDRDYYKGLANRKQGTVDKKKLVKWLHPDQYSKALEGHPDLAKKINDAVAYINNL